LSVTRAYSKCKDHITLSGYIFATGMYRQPEKKLLNSNISCRCPHNMANIGLLAAQIRSGVWGTPANFKGFRVLASLLHRRRSQEANNFARSLAISWADTLYIHFGGSCPLTEFYQMQNSLWVQVLRSSILAVWLHSTRAAAVSQTLRRGTRNGITELSQRAPPIFGWAAITLGIGQHSTFDYVTTYKTHYLNPTYPHDIKTLPKRGSVKRKRGEAILGKLRY